MSVKLFIGSYIVTMISLTFCVPMASFNIQYIYKSNRMIGCFACANFILFQHHFSYHLRSSPWLAEKCGFLLVNTFCVPWYLAVFALSFCTYLVLLGGLR